MSSADPARPPARLDDLVPCWRTIIARDARPIGFRLAWAASGTAAGAGMAAHLSAMLAAFGDEGGAPFPRGLVLLAPPHGPIDEDLASLSAPRNVLIEVDESVLGDEAALARLADVQRRGARLALRAADRARLPHACPPIFQYVVAPDHSERGPADLAWLAIEVADRAHADAVFKAGAGGIIGLPLEPVESGGGLQPQQKSVLELIRLVQADADVALLERVFKGEPVLSYLLLTLANSPAFVRTTPASSLSQAISLLGYRRLVKWLVLLLVIASKHGAALPAIYAAVTRGFTMENLAVAQHAAASVRDDCFIVGAFSLLDMITGAPLKSLMDAVPLPSPVLAALRDRQGPYLPYLRLAQALESGDGALAQQQAAALGVSFEMINRALAQALAATDALQSLV